MAENKLIESEDDKCLFNNIHSAYLAIIACKERGVPDYTIKDATNPSDTKDYFLKKIVFYFIKFNVKFDSFGPCCLATMRDFQNMIILFQDKRTELKIKQNKFEQLEQEEIKKAECLLRFAFERLVNIQREENA